MPDRIVVVSSNIKFSLYIMYLVYYTALLMRTRFFEYVAGLDNTSISFLRSFVENIFSAISVEPQHVPILNLFRFVLDDIMWVEFLCLVTTYRRGKMSIIQCSDCICCVLIFVFMINKDNYCFAFIR